MDKLLSVIYGGSSNKAFEQILEYFVNDPNKIIVDSTASDMNMWNDNMIEKYNPITVDIDERKNPQIVGDCSELGKFIEYADVIIYDPPYIDLTNRKDSKEYEDRFGYSYTKTLEDFEKLTRKSSKAFSEVLPKDGILICKITNFHYKSRLRGTYDLKEWLDNNFYLWDEIIYRYYKHIPNLNWYKLKVPKTHSYFLIFKNKKK